MDVLLLYNIPTGRSFQDVSGECYGCQGKNWPAVRVGNGFERRRSDSPSRHGPPLRTL